MSFFFALAVSNRFMPEHAPNVFQPLPRVVVVVSNPTAQKPTRRRKDLMRGGSHRLTPSPRPPPRLTPRLTPSRLYLRGDNLPRPCRRFCKPWVRHDPINYLQFRRTKESVQVVRRSRHLALKQTVISAGLVAESRMASFGFF